MCFPSLSKLRSFAWCCWTNLLARTVNKPHFQGTDSCFEHDSYKHEEVGCWECFPCALKMLARWATADKIIPHNKKHQAFPIGEIQWPDEQGCGRVELQGGKSFENHSFLSHTTQHLPNNKKEKSTLRTEKNTGCGAFFVVDQEHEPLSKVSLLVFEQWNAKHVALVLWSKGMYTLTSEK